MRKISIVEKNEFEPILQLLDDDERYIPDIHNASYKGHFQEIHRLINEDPEVVHETMTFGHASNITPLFFAAQEGH